MDHKAEFKLLVLERLGKEQADQIEWSSPRLLCIAGDFTNYDEHAVKQIPRSIELLRYRRYGDDYLLLELVNATTAQITATPIGPTAPPGSYADILSQASQDVRERFETLKAFLLALGDDVQMKTLKQYFSFRRIHIFADVGVRPKSGRILVWAKLSPQNVTLEPRFTKGDGDNGVIITIESDSDLARAMPLLVRCYEGR